MVVEMKCRTCGYAWSLATGVTLVQVERVQPPYRPPCPVCGGRHEQIIVKLEDSDIGALELTTKGGESTAQLM